MVSSREDFLMNLLNCGVLDLKLIDGVGYDWCDMRDAVEKHVGDLRTLCEELDSISKGLGV